MGFLYAFAAAVTWGAVYAIDQRILHNLSPLAVLLVDSFLGVVLMIPFVLTQSGLIKEVIAAGKTNLWLILISLALATLANYFIYSSIKILGASTASVMEIIYLFFVVLFSLIFFQVYPNIYFLLGGLLIFFGSAIIIYTH